MNLSEREIKAVARDRYLVKSTSKVNKFLILFIHLVGALVLIFFLAGGFEAKKAQYSTEDGAQTVTITKGGVKIGDTQLTKVPEPKSPFLPYLRGVSILLVVVLFTALVLYQVGLAKQTSQTLKEWLKEN